MLSMVFVMLTMSIASAERICEVLNEKPDLKNPDQPVTDVKDGSIEFDHVTFRYNAGSEKPILSDINLSLGIYHRNRCEAAVEHVVNGLLHRAAFG